MDRNWAKITDDLIRRALAEDIGGGDVTTLAAVPPEMTSTAYIYNKGDGVLAGIDIALKVFRTLDPSLVVTALYRDGDAIRHGHKIAEISGPVASILTAERTALNFLGRMSGIASLTAEYAGAVKNTGANILDTRKTNPTMRHLDKYAVRMGGGHNHRFGLNDMVLIKDNHIVAAGSIRIAVTRVVEYMKKIDKQLKVEVECKSYDEVIEAVYTPVDIIMLDNMDIGEIEKCVNVIREANTENGRHIRVEASGNITIKNIADIARTGIDYISLGVLTHSVMNHDFSLLFDEM